MTAITNCLLEEAAAIADAAKRQSIDQVETALLLLESCAVRKAKLVITGVGKSGIVARKIAATFSSIGLMAIYLNPLDALHGDLGVVASNDVCILLSNSGETEELLQLLPHFKSRGTSLLAIVGRLDSSLAQSCKVVLDASVNREVCPLNLAPTASTAVAMAIGDALAAVWMERSGISSSDFAVNHPAGSLGKKLSMTVSNLMISVTKIPPLQTSSTLSKVITNLTQGAMGSSWVEDCNQPGRLFGLITDGDLRRALIDGGTDNIATITAADLMTENPITVHPDLLAAQALTLMENNPRGAISVLPVISDSGEMLGLLRIHDLVQAGLA